MGRNIPPHENVPSVYQVSYHAHLTTHLQLYRNHQLPAFAAIPQPLVLFFSQAPLTIQKNGERYNDPAETLY